MGKVQKLHVKNAVSVFFWGHVWFKSWASVLNRWNTKFYMLEDLKPIVFNCRLCEFGERTAPLIDSPTASSRLILYPPHSANKLDQHYEAKSFPSLFCHLPFFHHSCRHLFPAVPVFQTVAVSNLNVTVPDILLFCCPLLVTLILSGCD